MMNKNFISYTVLGLMMLNIVSVPTLALAEEKRPMLESVQAKRLTASETGMQRKEVVKTKIEDQSKDRAIKEIDRRLTILNRLNTKLSSAKKLSASDKAALGKLIQDYITQLTSLKSKIETASDMTTLKADIQSIVKDYRVYALLVPKIELISTADTMLITVDKLTEVSTKLKTAIDQAKSEGKETTTLETNLKELNTKIASAQADAQTAHDSALSLKPEEYPNNKIIMKSTRDLLHTAKKKLLDASKLARTIYKELKGEKDDSATSSAKTLR